jgi:ribosomal protein S12 methylthiotransferase accessory factor
MPPLQTRQRVSRLAIVFVGPSIPHNSARDILKADYRPPIRRGDLEDVPPGSVIAIIDGVFDQNLSVSPSEIRSALERDVRIYGASSMGALRAVEVPGVNGVGRIYEMFRSGAIDGDDEVAIVFDPQTMRPLCEPLVNVRHAVERLAGPGTISRELGFAIVGAARKLPYFERTYPRILKAAGLSDHKEASHLASMLASHDLKREDAVTLLELLREAKISHSPARSSPEIRKSARFEPAPQPKENRPIHCWEFGPPLAFRELIEFLALTGTLSKYAVKAYTRIDPGEPIPAEMSNGPSSEILRARLLAQTARAWQWATEEEVDTSLSDLGFEHALLEEALARRVEVLQRVMASTRAQSDRFLEALRVELFLDDLALKRETARALSLNWLAKRAERLWKKRLSATEQNAAKDILCRMLDLRDARTAVAELGWWGLSPETVQQFIERLAFAKRLVQHAQSVTPVSRRRTHPWLQSSPKAGGSKRFCTTPSQAYSVLRRLKPVVGITRVAIITRLRTVGIPNAQAFRPDGEWSSTVGSGKSESTAGAKVGAMMEEIEKWAQEQFARQERDATEQVTSFETLRRRGQRVIDPSTLDLPYDSCYAPDLVMGWHACVDLASGGEFMVPTAAITHRRVSNDIYYSSQGGRKTITTNGLASGMTIAEALTHALCEYIERHALVVDTVSDGNPGGPTTIQRPFIDLETVPRSTRRLMGKISRAGYRLTVRDITSEVRVPTFNATIFLPEGSVEGELFNDGWQRASGWAAHPDPETGLNMAILEASQTIMTHVAGAREDLVLQARSLGRHERTDSRRQSAFAAEMDPDAPRCAFADVSGLSSNDAAEDVRWVLKRLHEAGRDHVLIADYSTDRIHPVRVVRAIIPGLETINPFHTGLRARKALLSDMLPSGG